MYDVWASQYDPGLWMIVPAGAPVPANDHETDWTLLGRCAVSERTARDIAEAGHAVHRSTRPFVPDGLIDATP